MTFESADAVGPKSIGRSDVNDGQQISRRQRSDVRSNREGARLGLGHFFLDADNPEILSMSVFGQMTPEKAIEEARFSLEAGGGSSDYEILGLIRADKQIP